MKEYLLIVFNKDGTIITQQITAKVIKTKLITWFYSNLYNQIISAQDYNNIDIIIFVNPEDIYGFGFVFDTKMEKHEVSGRISIYNKKRRSGYLTVSCVADAIPSKYIQQFIDLITGLGYSVE